MKILLLGKDGQVGREMHRLLQTDAELVALGRERADLEDFSGLRDLMRAIRPEVLVNAAAYTAVDRAESDEAAAFRVNADAVGVLAEEAARQGTLLVHYSTDYVFDGCKTAPYVETDATNPLSVYGRSKRAGEERIAKSGCSSLVFRTSWVFSAHGGNFVKTVLRLAEERDSLDMVADQTGAPTAAGLIAEISARAIDAFRNGTLSSGIYHLAAAGETTWYGLACHVVERAWSNGMRLALQSAGIRPIPTEAYPRPAKRPGNSRLDTHALCRALALDLPHWKVHVDRVVDQLSAERIPA